MVYVTVMSYGSHDENEAVNIYAGVDYEQSKKAAQEFVFPDPWQNWGYVEHWDNGKMVKNELVRE